MPQAQQEQQKITRVLNAVAAGTTNQNTSSVDMTGWDSVEFVAHLGALTATQVTKLKAQTSSDDALERTRLPTSRAARRPRPPMPTPASCSAAKWFAHASATCGASSSAAPRTPSSTA
jgi:hypothetical protein